MNYSTTEYTEGTERELALTDAGRDHGIFSVISVTSVAKHFLNYNKQGAKVARDIQTVLVELAERSYDIEISSGNLAELHDFLRQRTNSEHALIITDSNVDELYADAAGDALVAEGWEVNVLVVDPGEPSKSTESADDLWNAMLAEGADRQSIVVAIGGGVVGDLAGFASILAGKRGERRWPVVIQRAASRQ